MADWYGSARTNYVKFADLDGLKKAIEPFDLSVEAHPNGTHYCIDSSEQFGGWPSAFYDYENQTEIEFDFALHVAPYLAVGEVLIALEVGAEKLLYLSGCARAYYFNGTDVKETRVSLFDIYEKAADEFGVSLDRIAEASYQNVCH